VAPDSGKVRTVTATLDLRPLPVGGLPERTSEPASILVVDDNAGKRLALRAVLSPLGYSIVEADSGLAALRSILEQNFAVILLDVCMPDMDGIETAALIRERWQSEMTPIIFITAFAADEIENIDRYSAGAVDFMCAPIPPEVLRAKVSVFANLFAKAEVLAARAEEVQASADQLRLLTDAAPVGIFQTDTDDCYTYTNPRWSEITGLPYEEAVGRPWDCMIDSDRHAGLRVDLAGHSMHGPEFGHRFKIDLPDSPPRVVLLNSRSIPDGYGGVSGWVGTLADVTDEAEAEAALSDARDQANEASHLKADFLANMSHEIRTPMNGVIGMTELLLETELDPVQRDYAQTVRNSGEALLTIIDEILDFSKAEAGKLKIEDVTFSVRSVVDDVVGLLAAPAQAKGLVLAAVVESPVPRAVRGDPGRVRQVLTNLIGNALKFTQTGTIIVRVNKADSVNEGAQLRFEVSDTGEGIAPNKLDLIFQPFVQADSSTSRKHGGTGLGLSISGQLVALMGGGCGVSSQLGEGSTFWFTIPAGNDVGQTANDSGPAASDPGRTGSVAADRQAPSADHQGSPGRLLVAEDNLINQKVVVAMLSRGGYTVDTVVNGAEAVKALACTPYDAVLMDCQMPEMDGYEATMAIRAMTGSRRLTPIIGVTAGAREEDRHRCLDTGMDAYLSKPLNKEALLNVVARSVKERAGQD
jgi:PAS domain S-box-containing protein